MKWKHSIPLVLAAGIIGLTCLFRAGLAGGLQGLEARTLDWRARLALHFPAPVATNLGFVFISDASIKALQDGSLGYRFGLYWPRQIYGRLLRELSAQGAAAVAFDVIFGELRPDHPPVVVRRRTEPDWDTFFADRPAARRPYTLADDSWVVESDDFFAWQLRRSGRALLAAERDLLPPDLFRTNALALGDIAADRDADGVLRRARAFRLYRRWHPLLERAAAEYQLELQAARFEPGRLLLPRAGHEDVVVLLDAEGRFALADLVGETLPAGWPERAHPFTEERVWHMGIVLAAQHLKLDLANAEVDLARGRIVLRGEGGVERLIPVDCEGYFPIDWTLTLNDPRLAREPIESLLRAEQAREAGNPRGNSPWAGRLVVLGSVATGNDLTDRGPTPLERDTVLVSKHWNVANSVLTGRFIRRTTVAEDCVLLAVLGSLAALATLRLRAVAASLSLAALTLGYVIVAVWLYGAHRIWLPVVLPVGGALLAQHGVLLMWRVVFEEQEKRRVRAIFSRIVSPNVVRELLRSETLALGGAQREVTVMFADVRGFTEFTDRNREQAAARVREQQLAGADAEAVYAEHAREMLATVNTYLALIANTVKQHEGTLDKYIGDCVMAFWGAPTPHPRHAAVAVRTAVDALRAVAALNQQRQHENRRREAENVPRLREGLAPQPLLPILQAGCGLNTGVVTVGLMGSEAHIFNYTVFGREVNLASRLESLSGAGRILIGQTTYAALQRDAPELAATCVPLPPVTVKGIRDPVQAYEVPWQTGVPTSA